MTKIDWCRWCKHAMPKGATVCTKCTLHQNLFFERAKQIITVATLMGLLTSATVFAAPYLSTRYYELFTAAKVEVRTFQTERDALVVNTGKLDIFVSHFEIKAPDLERSAFVPIAETIKPNQTIKVDTRGLYSKRVEDSESLPTWDIVIHAPKALYGKLEDDRVTPVYMATHDFGYLSLVGSAPNERPTAPKADCKIVYSSKAQGQTSAPFECVAGIGTKGKFAAVFFDIFPQEPVED